MSVWSELVGQADTIETLKTASADAACNPPGNAMTHAWLFTGPPGSGRSTAAISFARALVCPNQGCGQCEDCAEVAGRAHPDVQIIRPEGISYKTSDARALVSRAAIAPARSRWHVIVVEDADRLTEAANNALLKAIEEPTPRAVWILCTPSAEDVLPTIRSRCRQVMLRTPATAEIADYLSTFEGVDYATALFASRAAQGHVGRARALATDDNARTRRQQILSIPTTLTDLASCLRAAAEIVATAEADAIALTAPVDEKERLGLRLAWGEGGEGKGIRGAVRGVKGALDELESRQKSRRTRTQRDQLDRALVDLLAFYRDVLAVQFSAGREGAAIPLINDELHAEIERTAAVAEPVSTMRRIDAIERARLSLGANVTPLLAIEAMMVDLRNPSLRRTIA